MFEVVFLPKTSLPINEKIYSLVLVMEKIMGNSLFFGDQLAQPNPGMSSLLMMVFFFLAFWFLLIAPQRKRQKAQEKMISELKAGDEVMTTSGLIGSVVQVKDNRLLLKSGDSKLELHKNFIQTKLENNKK